jgi:hypothetical protein
MTKQIKCSRCKKWFEVPNDYAFRECPNCHDRSTRKSSHMTELQLENMAVKRLIDFESAWLNYKKFCRKWKGNRKTKPEFEKEWMEQQKPKIANIKSIIAKYGIEFPLKGTACLKFRFMLTERNSNPDFQPDDVNLYFDHILVCDECCGYWKAHKDDGLLTISAATDEGVSQTDFDKALDGFYSVFQPKKDTIDSLLDSMHSCCLQCGRNLITLQNGRQICPNCEPEG